MLRGVFDSLRRVCSIEIESDRVHAAGGIISVRAGLQRASASTTRVDSVGVAHGGWPHAWTQGSWLEARHALAVGESITAVL